MGQGFPCEVYATITPVARREISDCLLEYRSGMLMISESGKTARPLDIDISTVKPRSPSRFLAVLQLVHQTAGFVEEAQAGCVAVGERMTMCFIGPGRHLKSAAPYGHSSRGVSEVYSVHSVVHVARELALAGHDVDRHFPILNGIGPFQGSVEPVLSPPEIARILMQPASKFSKFRL